jgi:hypothetical protein
MRRGKCAGVARLICARGGQPALGFPVPANADVQRTSQIAERFLARAAP